VNTLAVRDEWRRRDWDSRSCGMCLACFWDRGERRVGLGVDSDNPTGARRLYERAGMRSVWQADVYEKRLRG
jgi:mycothiol synthase